MIKLYIFVTFMTITTLSHAATQGDIRQSSISLCESVSDFSKIVMQARQQNLKAETVKIFIEKGLKLHQKENSKINDTALQTLLEEMVDETQFFPIYSTESEKNFMMNMYPVFVLNRCHENLKTLIHD